MASSTKLAFLAIAVLLLLQASWCAVALQAIYKPALMSVTSFEEGGPASCDGKYHSNADPLVALSTDLFNGGSMCLKNIYISHEGSPSLVLVNVVDECDTQSGCKANMLATSQKVWDQLKVDSNLGEVPVNWTATCC